MSSFSEQDPHDPDDPELDYTPLRLRERAAKLGPYLSQRARSEPIRSPPIPRPAQTRRTQREQILVRDALNSRHSGRRVGSRVGPLSGFLEVREVALQLMRTGFPAS
jgi:hypothetical protein